MKIRVLHCLQMVWSGGVEQRRLLLARHLDRARFEQSIVCTRAVGGLPEQLIGHGTSVHEVGTFRGIIDPERFARALAHVREFRPHIIHGAVYEGVALAAIAGRLGNVPIVIGEETSEPAGRSWKGHLLFRGLMSLTHHRVAVSEAVARYLVEDLRLSASTVSCIQNGVEPPRAVSAAEVAELRRNTGTENHLVIGAVGRLVDTHKGHSLLLRAAKDLIDQGLPIRILLVGAGPSEGELRSLAGDLGISDAVIFAGYQADTTPWYAMMDVLAHPSWHESFGLVLVEAMFAGVPVVATSVGGIPEIVVDGETGLLVPPGDETALAKKLSLLLGDPALRERIGNAGLARAAQQFSASRYVGDVQSLYETLVEANRSRIDAYEQSLAEARTSTR